MSLWIRLNEEVCGEIIPDHRRMQSGTVLLAVQFVLAKVLPPHGRVKPDEFTPVVIRVIKRS
jgi:hypothetical protein